MKLKGIISLGIDPSLRGTGLVVLNNLDVVLKERINTDSKMEKGLLERMASENKIFKKVFETLLVQTPDIVTIEGYSFGSKGSLTDQAEVTGIIMLALSKHIYHLKASGDKLPVIMNPSPNQLKMFITGKGTGKKELILKEVYKKYKFDTDDNNIADAYGLARLGYESLYLIEQLKYSKSIKEYQKRVFSKLDLTKDVFKVIGKKGRK